MPRVTRKSSAQEVVVDVNSSPEKDDKKRAKTEITNSSKSTNHPQSQCVMIVPGKTI